MSGRGVTWAGLHIHAGACSHITGCYACFNHLRPLTRPNCCSCWARTLSAATLLLLPGLVGHASLLARAELVFMTCNLLVCVLASMLIAWEGDVEIVVVGSVADSLTVISVNNLDI